MRLNDGSHQLVSDFLFETFHYKHDMVGYVVLILFAFIAAFWMAGWAAFRFLNFNVRPAAPTLDLSSLMGLCHDLRRRCCTAAACRTGHRTGQLKDRQFGSL